MIIVGYDHAMIRSPVEDCPFPGGPPGLRNHAMVRTMRSPGTQSMPTGRTRGLAPLR